MIHPSSVVGPDAVLGDNVEIGPFCLITGKVVIGSGCRLLSHVCLRGPLILGQGNTIYPYACIGYEPQDYKFDGATAGVLIGNDNTLRESVTIHSSTRADKPTTIGNNNLIMTSGHVGHDATVGSRCTIVTGVGVGGHAVVEDEATLGWHSGTHQFCRIGRLSFLGAHSLVTKDVPPFALTSGINKVVGVNVVGLRRRGIAHNAVDAVKAAFKTLYLSGHTVPVATAIIEETAGNAAAVGADLCQELVSFIRQSHRGLVPHAVIAAKHRIQR